jgi:electron transfer flavoprotein alpha/beta subunit
LLSILADVKVICLVKQVPEPGAIEFDPETQTLKREGVPLVLNPFDAWAVQHAAAIGDEVVALTMGPPQAEEALRECLALGAHRGVLLSDRAFAGADTIGTTRTLALALQKEGFDLVLCGRKSIDAETQQVPPELAAFLDVPHLTNIVELERDGRTLRAIRETDDADEVWEVPTPAVLAVAAPPREAPATRNGAGPIDTWSALDLVDEVYDYDKRFGQNGSPTRVLAVRDVTPERAQLRAASVEEARGLIAALLAERSANATEWEKPPHAAEKPAAHYDCWTWIETRDGVPTRASLELLGRGRTLAGKLGGANVALVFDDVPDLGRYGAERVHKVEANGAERHPELVAVALRSVLERQRPHVLLLPASTAGRDIGPRAAGELTFGMTADCVGVDIAKAGRLLQQKPAFGGNIVSVIMGSTTPQLATVRPRMYEPLEPRDARAEETSERVDLPAPRLRLLERRPHERPGHDLDEADTVLLLGERAPDLEPGAVVGVTRGVVERGDAHRWRHVGLLGRQIAPRLLIAVGVDGTPEAISGFVKAAVVVSVAGDAAMNERADVLLEGDARELVPQLLA